MLAALAWLKQNNRHYGNVRIDRNWDPHAHFNLQCQEPDDETSSSGEDDEAKKAKELMKKLKESEGDHLLTQAFKDTGHFAAVDINPQMPRGSAMDHYRLRPMTGTISSFLTFF